MSHLLDTNVISEWVKPQPDPGVVAWLSSMDEDRLYLSVITLAEIRRGIELLPEGRRRALLATWLADDLPLRFEGRLLDINPWIAQAWGSLLARAQRTGITLGAMDGFIAASAVVHGLTLVTRNVGDFERLGIPLLNPWHPAD